MPTTIMIMPIVFPELVMQASYPVFRPLGFMKPQELH